MRSPFAFIWSVLLFALVACSAVQQTPADPAAEGRRIFAIWCTGCHSVEAGAPAGIGPDLAGVAGRAADNPDGLAAAEWLRRETVSPDVAVAPGYAPGLMPATYGRDLRPEQIEALVAYMLTLE